MDSIELLGLVDEGETLQLLQTNWHWSRTTPRRARNWARRSFHPWLPLANHLLAVHHQLRLTDQHLAFHLQTEVGGGLEEPTLDSVANLQVQVAVRSDNTGVKGDDASVTALANDHPTLAKEPQPQTSRADNDGVLPKKVKFRVA